MQTNRCVFDEDFATEMELTSSDAGRIFVINNEPYIVCDGAYCNPVLVCLTDGMIWSSQPTITPEMKELGKGSTITLTVSVGCG